MIWDLIRDFTILIAIAYALRAHTRLNLLQADVALLRRDRAKQIVKQRELTAPWGGQRGAAE